MSDVSMINGHIDYVLKPCPFCGSTDVYDTFSYDDMGTKLPVVFCNCCKCCVQVENDSPYMDDASTFEYLHSKVIELWNTRSTIK